VVSVNSEIDFWESGFVGDGTLEKIIEEYDLGETRFRRSRNGTDYSKFFKRLKEEPNPPDCVVFFTDLMNNWNKIGPDSIPECAVLWITEKKNISGETRIPPFGEIYLMSEPVPEENKIAMSADADILEIEL